MRFPHEADGDGAPGPNPGRAVFSEAAPDPPAAPMPNDITSTVVAAGPAELYRASCAAGQIQPDPEQTHAADPLQQRYAGLATHQPEVRRAWRSPPRLAALISEAPPPCLYPCGPLD